MPESNPLPVTPTERETEILKILWAHGRLSVRDVYEIMRERENIAQNTVQTFLRIMEDKGLVKHTVEGRAFIYEPLYSRTRSVTRFLDHVFDGAADQLVLNLFKAKNVSKDELQKIEDLIASEKKKRGLR